MAINKMPTASESVEQINLFSWANFMLGKYPELNLLYHIPNEGKRSYSVGARMKMEGLKAGVPDICLPVARGKYHGMYIEMKAGKNKTTNNQEQWLSELRKQGYVAEVCYGWTQAQELILKYLNLPKCDE